MYDVEQLRCIYMHAMMTIYVRWSKKSTVVLNMSQIIENELLLSSGQRTVKTDLTK